MSRSKWFPWLAGFAVLAIAGFVSVAVWASRCFQDHRITSGSYMGMTIGADKAVTFAAVLALYQSGKIGGFTGLDRHSGPSPRHYSLDLSSPPEQSDRMVLYNRWDLVASDGAPLGFLEFEDGMLRGISLYDERGYFTGTIEQWTPRGGAHALNRGMSPQEARSVVMGYVSSGSLGAVKWNEHFVAPPTRLDDSAYSALQPWGMWQLFTKDWGAIWLTFDGDRLHEIHHRIQCTELP